MNKQGRRAESEIQAAWAELEKTDPAGMRVRLRESFFFAISKANPEGALCVLRELPELAFERSRGASALHWACVEPRLSSLIPVLLALGADPCARAEKARVRDDSPAGRALETSTPLDWAAEAGNIAGLQRLLLDPGLQPTADDLHRALKIAARVGFGDVCLFLMERGADALARDPLSVQSPNDRSTSAQPNSTPQALGSGSGSGLPGPSQPEEAQLALPLQEMGTLGAHAQPIASDAMTSGVENEQPGSAQPGAQASALEWLTWRLLHFPQGPTQRDGKKALAAMEARSLAFEIGAEKESGVVNSSMNKMEKMGRIEAQSHSDAKQAPQKQELQTPTRQDHLDDASRFGSGPESTPDSSGGGAQDQSPASQDWQEPGAGDDKGGKGSKGGARRI